MVVYICEADSCILYEPNEVWKRVVLFPFMMVSVRWGHPRSIVTIVSFSHVWVSKLLSLWIRWSFSTRSVDRYVCRSTMCKPGEAKMDQERWTISIPAACVHGNVSSSIFVLSNFSIFCQMKIFCCFSCICQYGSGAICGDRNEWSLVKNWLSSYTENCICLRTSFRSALNVVTRAISEGISKNFRTKLNSHIEASLTGRSKLWKLTIVGCWTWNQFYGIKKSLTWKNVDIQYTFVFYLFWNFDAVVRFQTN